MRQAMNALASVHDLDLSCFIAQEGEQSMQGRENPLGKA